jgi:hypothetical protein
MEKPNRLAEIPVKGLYPDAVQIDMSEILGKEIMVEDMTEVLSDYGRFAVFLFKIVGEETLYSTACGGYQVVQRLVEAKKNGWFPLPANITKVGRRYEVK